MTMLSVSSRIGLAICDQEMVVASLRKYKEEYMVLAQGKRRLDPGDVLNGVIQNPNEFGETLTNLLMSLRLSTIVKNIAVCLPPNLIFTTTVPIPRGGKKQQEEALRNEVSRNIPLPFDDVALSIHAIAEEKDGMILGIAAVRVAILEGIITACTASNLTLEHITSIPGAFITAIPQDEREEYLLICEKNTPSITHIHTGFPVDETVLDGKATHEDIAKEAIEMLTYADRTNTLPTGIGIVGSPGLTGLMQKRIEEKKWDILVKRVLTGVCQGSECDIFLPAMAASLIGKNACVPDFAFVQGKGK